MWTQRVTATTNHERGLTEMRSGHVLTVSYVTDDDGMLPEDNPR